MSRKKLGVVLLASAASLLGSCGGSQREVAGQVATQSVREFQNSLVTAPQSVDAAVATLNKLTSGEAVDRSALLKEFNAQVRSLEAQAVSVRRMRDQAMTDADKFFGSWLRETSGIKSPAERDAAVAQLASSRDRVRRAQEYLDGGSANFRTLMNDLTGIQQTLNKDLSPASVEAVGRNLGPVYDRAANVNNFLARMNEQIDSILTGR